MGCVDKTVVVAEALSSVELSSVDMAVTSVSRCVVVVVVVLLLLLLLLLFPSHSMFSTTAVATVVQLSTSSPRAFFATHPSRVLFAFVFSDIGECLKHEYSFSTLVDHSKSISKDNGFSRGLAGDDPQYQFYHQGTLSITYPNR